ncbi:aspartyl-tRNA amidotransferase [candidate division CPR3 bacterium GWF2_35_18]|uniref:YqeY-like protein n=1 Tax=candidate division CPR3 bacterium GW2011_GWF2_35_18 TaxID=1618350 RepID=A0A0G0BJ23_UNCC3|nr:MAG: YqeY-like protein [candidate division CPR3 bacterium GW2011_GWF2_35_18]OGB62966.1 MAG: aspartyl-tRNA amidotransferase [candidate division CPR3 bacterium GWF2_35_18]OGB65908.1 MAG: aspartyl-tRNA amidotransferase [candidate division CPR3 bacterium RIFOXYA2_FULL_35_13]OGB76718.1 MAG: aspartyl-tRNA amidotransferase [candidate division CPR3 bacterium RIFOXYC2_FULL_35_7]OGB78919.1 MAG: aspartyl-tRNA amidotransferase [candidate division CPR3 bacterium RIFOXYB2_FULL_35_8]
MSLKENIETDLKKALKEGDKLSLSVLRMIIASIRNEKIKQNVELTDEETIKLLLREVKIRRQSIEEFKKGNRTDLADREASEIDIIQKYLPQSLTEDELGALVDIAIQKLEAKSLSDMGKVMSFVMGKTKGRAEGQKVSTLVKQKLS